MIKRVNLSQTHFVEEVQALLHKGHSVTLTVKGNSMNPFLKHDRDKVILNPCKSDDLQIGDFILALDTCNHYVLHRIVELQDKMFVLIGDGNYNASELVEQDKVIALVSAVIRKEKQYLCNNKTWKAYSWLWMKALPLRRYLLAICRRLNLI